MQQSTRGPVMCRVVTDRQEETDMEMLVRQLLLSHSFFEPPSGTVHDTVRLVMQDEQGSYDKQYEALKFKVESFAQHSAQLTQKHDLDPNQALALMYFTADMRSLQGAGLDKDDGRQSLCHLLQDDMASTCDIQKWTGFLYFFITALAKLPDVQTTVATNSQLLVSGTHDVKPGQSIALSSFTPAFPITKQANSDTKHRLVINAINATDVSGFYVDVKDNDELMLLLPKIALNIDKVEFDDEQNVKHVFAQQQTHIGHQENNNLNNNNHHNNAKQQTTIHEGWRYMYGPEKDWSKALQVFDADSATNCEALAGKAECLWRSWGLASRSNKPKARLLFSEAALRGSRWGRIRQWILRDKFVENEELMQDLHQLASDGFAPAQNCIGWCFDEGKGVEANMPVAVDWYTRAAAQGYSVSISNLGSSYEFGQGVDIDFEKAVFYYRKAADLGDVEALCSLAVCYEFGKGVHKDHHHAVSIYRQLADTGHGRSQCNLGVCYRGGIGVPQDNTQAVYWYRRAALQGESRAQFNLGLCYENARGVDKSNTHAVFWYLQAAAQNYTRAQHNLASCFESGRGVARDFTQAVHWYRKAADDKYKPSQYCLGQMYQDGHGVDHSDEEAVVWFRKAAEDGYDRAQSALGMCYATGKGVAADSDLAYQWFRKAAEQNNIDGLANTGLCHEYGVGTALDYDEALFWYLKAAELNHSGAQFLVGNLYKSGKTQMSNDLGKAFFWLSQAANAGSAQAKAALVNF